MSHTFIIVFVDKAKCAIQIAEPWYVSTKTKSTYESEGKLYCKAACYLTIITSLFQCLILLTLSLTLTSFIEVKVKAAEDDPHLGKMIENLTCGKDIDEHCFEEALEIAVAKNRHKAAGFLILQGASNLLQCLQDALMKPFCYKTAVLLLLCHAAKTGDIEIINLMCSKEPPDILKRESSSPVHVKSDSGKEVKREYLPKEWDRKLPLHVLEDLRYEDNLFIENIDEYILYQICYSVTFVHYFINAAVISNKI